MSGASTTARAAAAARLDEGMRARAASRAARAPTASSRGRATSAAHEVEGDDGDEAMAGDENISMQRAEGVSGSTGGIKKKKNKRSKQRR